MWGGPGTGRHDGRSNSSRKILLSGEIDRTRRPSSPPTSATQNTARRGPPTRRGPPSRTRRMARRRRPPQATRTTGRTTRPRPPASSAKFAASSASRGATRSESVFKNGLCPLLHSSHVKRSLPLLYIYFEGLWAICPLDLTHAIPGCRRGFFLSEVQVVSHVLRHPGTSKTWPRAATRASSRASPPIRSTTSSPPSSRRAPTPAGPATPTDPAAGGPPPSARPSTGRPSPRRTTPRSLR